MKILSKYVCAFLLYFLSIAAWICCLLKTNSGHNIPFVISLTVIVLLTVFFAYYIFNIKKSESVSDIEIAWNELVEKGYSEENIDNILREKFGKRYK